MVYTYGKREKVKLVWEPWLLIVNQSFLNIDFRLSKFDIEI